MAVVTSRENTLLTIKIGQTECAHENLDSYSKSELSITKTPSQTIPLSSLVHMKCSSSTSRMTEWSLNPLQSL